MWERTRKTNYEIKRSKIVGKKSKRKTNDDKPQKYYETLSSVIKRVFIDVLMDLFSFLTAQSREMSFGVFKLSWSYLFYKI